MDELESAGKAGWRIPAVLVLVAPVLYAVPALEGAPKAALVAILFASILPWTSAVLTRPEGRRELERKLCRRMPMIASALVFLAASWAAACLTGLKPHALNLAVCTCVLVYCHVLIPVFLPSEDAVDRFLKTMAAVGLAAIGVSWILFVVKILGGPGWGVMPTGDLVLEKRAILEALSVPFALKGPFVHPNYLGLIVVCAMPGLLRWGADRKRPSSRIWCGAGIALCLLTLAASFAIISAIPVAITLLGMALPGRRALHRTFGIAALAGVLFFAAAVVAHLRLDFLKALPVKSETRIELWSSAIDIISRTGGWGVSPDEAARLMPYGLTSHNTVIETALTSGTAAMAGYVLFLCLLLGSAMRRLKDGPSLGVFYLVFGCVFMQMFEFIPFGRLGVVINFYFLAVAVPFALSRPAKASGGKAELP